MDTNCLFELPLLDDKRNACGASDDCAMKKCCKNWKKKDKRCKKCPDRD